MKLNIELSSPRLLLRPLLASDFDELFAIASDPLIWEQHPVPNRYEKTVFRKFFDEGISQNAFAIIDRTTHSIIGSTRFYQYHESKSEVAIGYTFLSRSVWGGSYNSELKELMLDYAFRFVDQVSFHVGRNNLRSQKAMIKIGARLVGKEIKTWSDRPPQESLVYAIKKEMHRAIQESVSYLKSPAAIVAIKTDPYWPKWNSTWWHITLLWEMGLSHQIPKSILQTIFESINDHYIHFFPKRKEEMPSGIDPYTKVPCHCYLGIAYQVLFEAGFDVDQKLPWIREWFFKYQLQDGGLNCSEDVYCKHEGTSSIVSSLPVFEAMLLVRDRKHSPEEKEFLDRGYVYLVKRKLFRSLRNHGKIMDENFLKIIFPRFYEYDVLRGLSFIAKYCSTFNIPFPKDELSEAIEVVKAQLDVNCEIKLNRKFWDQEKTYQKNSEGKWSWGAPSNGFKLLKQVSEVGTLTPYLNPSIEVLKPYLSGP